MSATHQQLHDAGFNPFAVQLLAESVLKRTGGPKAARFIPVQREDCAGWSGIALQISPISDEEWQALADSGEPYSFPDSPEHTDWGAAATRLEETRKIYTEIGASGAPALRLTIDPLLVRFESGERTPELHAAIMELE